MGRRSTRRAFMQTMAAGTATTWALGHKPGGSGIPPVTAAESQVPSEGVHLRPEIADTVRLLEETPRAKLLEEVARRIQRGLSYQDVVTALQLASIRNVQPRPSVGYKFHAVLVVNSVHLASLAAADEDRWLPIFWALDYFKSAQARDVREGNWTMQPVRESAVPPPQLAIKVFRSAMEAWDEERADAAAAALARFAGEAAVFEEFFRYGCRDFRSIGHKAIFVSNARRTLQCMGWQHAEPVLRSLAYALLNHHGEPNPAGDDLAPDRSGKRNAQLVHEIKPGWVAGAPDRAATEELLATLRTGSADEASDHVVRMLNDGVGSRAVWDALLLGAGELLMRQPGIVALHAMTTTNAMYYAFTASGDNQTRQLLMLQNAAFLPHFLEAMRGRGQVKDARVDQLPETQFGQSGDAAVEAILAEISTNRSAAAAKACAYLAREPAEPLLRGLQRTMLLKGNDAHDYKFGSAVLEDAYHVSPAWRPQFLATTMFILNGSGARDSGLVERTRAAFKA